MNHNLSGPLAKQGGVYFAVNKRFPAPATAPAITPKQITIKLILCITVSQYVAMNVYRRCEAILMSSVQAGTCGRMMLSLFVVVDIENLN